MFIYSCLYLYKLLCSYFSFKSGKFRNSNQGIIRNSYFILFHVQLGILLDRKDSEQSLRATTDQQMVL